MTEHAWFKLLLRALGILVCGFAVPSLLTQGGYLIQALASSSPIWPDEYYWAFGGGLAGSLAQAAIGLYLLFGGNWIINRCLKEVRNRCISCGYDLTASTADACPECGAPILRPAPGRPAAPAPPEAPR